MKKKPDSKAVSRLGGPNPPTLRRVLVPTDFSDSSLSALRYAAALAMKFDASLTVLHVVPADYGWLGLGQEESRAYDETLQSQAAARLRALAESHIPQSALTHLEVRLGRPAEEIAAAAADSKSDLILLSTHGHTGLDRYLIGSVADRVARLAPCPVFLMRPGKPSPSRKPVRPPVLRFKTQDRDKRPKLR
jgi:nucleotide-binding universal stress UspA family protein